MKKAILFLSVSILAACASPKPAKKMYIITVLKKEYNPITGTMDPVADVDTAYETNDLDAYYDGVISYFAIVKVTRMLKTNIQKAVSFSVMNDEGIDISILLSEHQKDSITNRIKSFL